MSSGDDLGGRLAALSPAQRERLLARLQDRTAQREAAAPRDLPRPAASDASRPLSFGQLQLWMLEQLAPGLPLYNLAAVIAAAGPLAVAALAAALGAVVDRHAALRTRVTVPPAGGEPRQEAAPAAVGLPVLDLSALPAAARDAEAARRQAAEAAHPFDLARGPLLRAALLRLAPERHRLLLTLHHIACDGWSIPILVRELGVLYAAAAAGAGAGADAGRELAALLPPLPMQYADFAAWQRRHLEGDRLAALGAWWRQQLGAPPPPLPLPLDRPRPAVRAWRGGQRSVPLPPGSLAAAAALAAGQGATQFMVLAAAFAALLLRYGGQTDVVIGTPVADRPLPQVEGLIGYFVNTLALRIDLGGDPSFAELVARVRQTALAAFEHQELPFELVVGQVQPQRDLALTPLFQVAFAVEPPPPPVAAVAGLRLTQLPVSTGSAKFDLTLTVEGSTPALPGAAGRATPAGVGVGVGAAPVAPAATAEYALALFDPPTVDRLLGHFGTLLAALAPGARLSELPLLAAAERHQLLHEWNDTAAAEDAAAPPVPVVQQVAAQVRRAPDALAVSDGATCLTYGELAASAGRLAEWLAGRGVGAETRVALCLGRSAAEVVAMLAVLGAGGAYVPLDPADPDERLAWLARDCGARLLLARGARATELAAALGPVVIDLDNFQGFQGLHGFGLDRPPHGLPPAAPAPAVPPLAALAYVIYTSGSTGEPRGVAVTHGGLANLLAWQRRRLGITAADRTTHLAGPAFDATVLELWPWLAAGAAVEVIDDATRLQPAALAARLAASGITHCFLPTPLAEALLATWQPPAGLALRTLATGGDRLRRWPPRPLPFTLLNLYGPTETTVVATCAGLASPAPASSPGPAAGPGPGDDSQPAAPPIGRPVDGLRVYVLDPQLRLVPLGAAGELCVAGIGVARGYLGRPAATAARFVPDPWGGAAGERLYRTGDLARQTAGGEVEFLGRVDRQVKVRGFRIEPGEVEAALAADPAVAACAALLRGDLPGGPGLVAFVVAAAPGAPGLADRLRQGLARRLPAFAVPALIVVLDALPLTANGKLDRRALAGRELAAAPGPAPAAGAGGGDAVMPRGEVEEAIAAVWREVLQRPQVGRGDSFFDLGGHSLLLVEAHGKLRQRFPALQVLDLFRHPTIAALAAHLAPAPLGMEVPAVLARGAPEDGADRAAGTGPAGRGPLRPAPAGGSRAVAVVGMAGRFPGAAGVEELWRNLRAGREAIQPLSAADLASAGVAPALLASPAYVRAAARVAGIDLFDATFFGLTPREAAETDPQHRLLLECAWEALENAGYDAASWRGRIGLFAGASTNRYFQHVEASDSGAASAEMALVGLDKDFLTTRVSYRLGLEGPSVAVQTACSTSLVAVHLACQSLLAGECDLALAGGIGLRNLYGDGYVFQEGGILSPDGHCRAFDAAAAGTVPGDGFGLVALRRLADALADGDAVAAVIKGSAINNDGAAKIGYTAPGLHGQVRVLRDALAAAEVDPATVSYIEAHGTGTPLGDPIELAALAEAYGAAANGDSAEAHGATGNGDGAAATLLGSIKTNIGHLDAAAGVAGLIKTVLALRQAEIPPSLHFTRLNPQIPPAAAARFAVAAPAARPWVAVAGQPRRAAVSSFGIGGTNAHVILEEAPPAAARPAGGSGGWQLLQLSARTETALDQTAANLAAHLEAQPASGPHDLADIAFTLRAGRRACEHRRAVVCRDAAAARAALTGDAAAGWTMSGRAGSPPAVAFLLPGQGAQSVGMAAGLYRTRPAFRAEIDHAAALLAPHLGADLRELLFPPLEAAAAARQLARTRFTQPAIFAVEYALARLWIGWGVRPAALLGHSIGEWVAACLAGVFSLADALALVALRGRLIDELPEGAMLAVPLSAAALAPLLGPDLSLAADNAADRAVASGPAAAIADLEQRLAARGIAGQRLRTSHAFHSPALEPAVAPLVQAVSEVARRPPALPFVSNLTGTWILAEEATDPAYWGRQLLQPVRFAAGLRTLGASRPGALLEVGPGESLSRLARRELRAHALPVLSTLAERPDAADADAEEHLLCTAARLWLAGAPLDPYTFTAHESRRRVALPTYPFERRRYWLPRPAPGRRVAAAQVAGPGPGMEASRGLEAGPGTERRPGIEPRPGMEPGTGIEPGMGMEPGTAARAGDEPSRSPAAGRKADPADWFYLPSWRRSLPPPTAAGDLPPGGYLLFGDRPGEPGGALTAAVAARLRAAARPVTVVYPGPAFAQLAADAFTLRPAGVEDLEALWEVLAASGRPCATVLHLWNTAEAADQASHDHPGAGQPAEQGESAALDSALERGFYSLTALGKALGRAASREPLELWVVSRRLHDVAGGECLAPERATLLGPCRVLPLELPHITCRSLDLPQLAPRPVATARDAGRGAEIPAVALAATTEANATTEADEAHANAEADLLLAEVAARPDDRVLAYRGPQRWTQDFEPVRLAAGAATPRPGAVYLITGGLGGVGHAVARWLARGGARLVLLGRSELPSRQRRDALLLAAEGVSHVSNTGSASDASTATDAGDAAEANQAASATDACEADNATVASDTGNAGAATTARDAASEGDAGKASGAGSIAGENPGSASPGRRLRQLRRWRELEDDGAEVLVATADVTDRAALARVRAEVQARFGRVDGVVHAAGVAGGGILQLRRREDAAAVLAPKVQGTLALAAVFPPEELELFVLCSSLNSVLGAIGQADYCAANAFLDAFAAARSSRRPRSGGAAGRVVSIAWDRWDEVGMAAEAAPTFEPRAADLPALSGEVVAHPLLDRRLPAQAGRHTFVTRFGAARHWMLDEHRFGGTPVLPGTAFLELARAAADLAGVQAGGAGIAIRNLTFVAPLVVPDRETCDVFTTVAPAGDGWEVRIASRAPGGGWREHAVGEVAPLAAPPRAPAGPTLADLLAAMPLAPLAPGGLPAPSVPAALAALPAPAAGALDGGAAAAPPSGHDLTFGPRWQGVAGAVAAAGDDFLARFDLDSRFAADLDALGLHPALLDLATGFVHAAAGAAAEPYLPFSYAGVRLARPLPAAVYSHARRLADTAPAPAADDSAISPLPPAPLTPAAAGATRRYAVTLYDAAGETLLTIDEYVFRRADPGGFRAGTAPSAIDATPSNAESAPADTAPAATRSGSPAPGEPAGLTTAEGVEVFARIFARMPLPQVLVSTRDLRARVAAAAADTGERLLAELAALGGAAAAMAPGDRHPRPQLAAPYAAPRDAAEERLAEIWQELLGIERIGVDDDFFELGGDSVLGLRIAAAARERGMVLSPNELFTHPTIAALARRVPAPVAAPAGGAAPGGLPRPAASRPARPETAAEPAAMRPDDFPDADVSARDLAALLAQLDASGG